MASMEIIPASNDGSISYFNPATKRFHDPVTKRMVPTPAMYKAGAVASTLKQEEPTTTPMNPLDSMMEIFREMRDNLKQLVAQGKRSVGIESKELAISKKELAADKFESGRESIEDADTDIPPPPDEKEGGFLSGIKNLKMPTIGSKGKMLLLAAGLFGLTKFSETIVKTLAPLLEWLDKTITVFKEKGFKGGMGFLKNEFKEKVIKPSLAAIGLEYNAQGGIDRIPGSWLDILDPISGPTNVFDTVMDSIIDTFNLLAAGRWPDGTKEGKMIFPEWMYGVLLPENPYFMDVKDVGFWGTLFNLIQLKKPDGTEIFGFLRPESEFFKTLGEDTDKVMKSLKKDMFGLLDTNFMDKFDDFMKNDFRTFMEGLVPSKETLAKIFISKDGTPLSELIETDIERMMKGLENISDFFYNKETGAVFGIDIQKMKDMLPTLQEMVDSIISSLPKFMRPDTIFEKIADTQGDITDVKDDIKKHEDLIAKKDYRTATGRSRVKLVETLNAELLELQDKEIELKSSVFGYNTDKPLSGNSLPQIDTQHPRHMKTKTKNLKAAAEEATTYEYGNTAPPIAIQANQGPTVVGNSNTISMPKGANHIDHISLFAFSQGAFLANGSKLT